MESRSTASFTKLCRPYGTCWQPNLHAPSSEEIYCFPRPRFSVGEGLRVRVHLLAICANPCNHEGTFNRQYTLSKSLIPIHKSLFHGIGTIKVQDMFPCNVLQGKKLTAHVNQERVKICKTVNSLKTKDLPGVSRTNKPCFTDTYKHFHIC